MVKSKYVDVTKRVCFNTKAMLVWVMSDKKTENKMERRFVMM